MPAEKKLSALQANSDGIAEKILARADRDIVFSIRILGESRNFLQEHFQNFIRLELDKRDVSFDDHPLLLPFIETHACELTEFVTTGVGLQHQFSVREFEKLVGDPMKLFRVDLWDSLSSYIKVAEQQFLSDMDGLHSILAAVAEERAVQAAKRGDVS